MPNKIKILFIAAFLSIFLLNGFSVFAQGEPIEINFFYSATCPHCAAEEEFLKGLEKKYSEIKINRYEVVSDRENQKLLQDFFAKYKVPENEQGWVPATFTPTKYFVGFNEQTGKDIESCLKECLGGEKTAAQILKVPILGNVDLSKMSLAGLTFVLGILDGFNPCAMWILVILISLLIPLRSRKKIALVGGIFIFAEGLLYFLFMTAWLNIFLAIKYGLLTRILIGIFGIVFGVWRIKDFLTWKPGVCKVVGDSKSQGKIMDKMNRVLKATTIPAMVAGVILLAFGVNLVEFLCSAGFPVMYTRILAIQDIGAFQHYLYLFFYIIFYMLDDLIIFGIAFFAFGRFAFSEKYNKYSTLIAGVLIFVLGILLIFKPGLLMFG